MCFCHKSCCFLQTAFLTQYTPLSKIVLKYLHNFVPCIKNMSRDRETHFTGLTLSAVLSSRPNITKVFKDCFYGFLLNSRDYKEKHCSLTSITNSVVSPFQYLICFYCHLLVKTIVCKINADQS